MRGHRRVIVGVLEICIHTHTYTVISNICVPLFLVSYFSGFASVCVCVHREHVHVCVCQRVDWMPCMYGHNLHQFVVVVVVCD